VTAVGIFTTSTSDLSISAFWSDDRPTGNYWSSIDEHQTDGLATIRPEPRDLTFNPSG
jgi:hypothetical protein